MILTLVLTLISSAHHQRASILLRTSRPTSAMPPCIRLKALRHSQYHAGGWPCEQVRYGGVRTGEGVRGMSGDVRRRGWLSWRPSA